MDAPASGTVIRSTQHHDPHVPEVPFHQYLLAHMDRYTGVAMVDLATGVQWTFAELSDSIRRLAAVLQRDQGLSRGECAIIALPNCPEFFVTLMAVAQCGAVPSLVNPLYAQRELEHAADIIRPTIWICAKDFLPALEALGNGGHSTRALVLDRDDTSRSQWHSAVRCSDVNAFCPPSVDVDNDVAAIFFSSGTSGLPKGVMLTHKNIVTSLCQSKVWCPFTVSTVNVAFLPMYHVYGFQNVLFTPLFGSKVAMMSKFSFVDLLEAIQRLKVTMLPLVPPVAILLAKHPLVAEYDLSSMTGIISSGALLGSDIVELLCVKYKCDVLQGCGMTEATLVTHFSPKDGQRKHGSVGKLMPFFEAKIVDVVTGHNLSLNQTGEICLKGPMVMKGYRGNTLTSAETIDADGWLHTGDVGYYDNDEWLYIVDRLKELIKYKGLQVPPTELENVLLTHPDIVDAAVIGIPDEMAGELPRAYVVKRPESTLTEKEVMEFVAGHVTAFKKLRGGVGFIESIPKLPSGKILRRQLRSLPR